MSGEQHVPEPLDLDAIEARAAAATPGPWWGGGDRERGDVLGLVGRDAERGGGEPIAVLAHPTHDHVADAEFIGHARQDVPSLVAEVRRLQADLHEYRDGASSWFMAGWMQARLNPDIAAASHSPGYPGGVASTVRAQPNRDAVAGIVRAALCGCGNGPESHPAERSTERELKAVDRATTALLALFGQEGQR